jgi:hypothetical protein
MATPYYVSQVDGNDSYNGLYPTFISGSDGPWLTISKADNLSGSQSDNSVLFNRGGTWREQYALECYGISGHPFTVGAYGTGNKPKIYGSDQLTGWTVYSGNIWQATTSINPNKSIYFVNTDGSVKWGTKQANADACDAEYEFFSNGTTMYCYALTDPDSRYTSVEVPTRAYCIGATGQSYITIDGLDIRHFTDNGIRIYTDAVYNTVQNCQISYGGESVSGAGQGIIIRGSYHQIIGNTIHDCSIHGIRTSTASGKTTSNITISENEVYDCYHSLIDLSNGNATGVSTDHTVTRNFLYTTSNYAYPSTLDCNGIYVAGASADQQNIEISYNVIINIFAAAIQIQNNVVNCNIYNNTCYGTNPVNNWSWTSGISIGGSGSSGIAVKNNIAANFYSGAGGGDSCFGCSNSAFMSSVDNNCWYQATGGRIFAHINTTNYYSGDFVAYKAATGWDTHGKWEDPKFVNAGGSNPEDYKLTATSPCINAGVDVGLTQDYEGNAVIGFPDIGAQEYGLGVASDYLENKLLDHVFKVASFSVPTNLYIALCKATVEDDDTGSTLPSEVSGGSYARKRCNTWTAASVGGTLSNNMAIQFVEASATWGTVTDFAVVDSGSGGNMLVYGKLSYAKRVLSGDIFKFATNDLDVAVN